MIASILRAQLLSMRLRTGARRGGAVFSALTGLLFYGVWAFLSLAAMMYFADAGAAPSFLPVLSTGLLFVMLYWQLAPVISAGFGASLDLTKLLIYPIPRRKLFTVEVLLRLTNCAEMLILLTGAALGLLRNPLYGAGTRFLVILGALTFVATNLLLSAGVRHLLERLFLRARMKEVLMFLLVALAVLPQILLVMNVRRATLVNLAPAQLFWPWGAVARVMLGARIPLAAPIALVYLCVAWSFGRWQFERSIRYDGTSGRPTVTHDGTHDGTRDFRRGQSLVDRLFRFPSRFLPDPIGALIEKELRTFARIPRFRMVYAMSCVFGIVLYLPALRGPRTGMSFFMRNALPLMALYGLMMIGPISYWNAFGFDRSAVQGYFSWPIRFRDVLFAKNITVALLLLPQLVIVSLVGVAAHLPVSPAKCVETLAVMLTASLYWFSMGNITSVRMPRPMDPAKLNQMANKMQALSIWTAPLFLLPIGLAYWAREVFDSEIAFAGVLLIAAIVGGIFYKVGLDSAVGAAERGRESMLIQLSRGDGPLSVT